MKTISILCSFFCASVALGQTKFTPVSNLNQPTAGGGWSEVFNAQSLAASFTTGNTETYLSCVSVSMANATASREHFRLSIYSDANGSPGTSLASLSGNAAPTNAAVYTYTNTSTLVLSAETTYWIVASSPDATLSGAFSWKSISGAGLDAGSFWTTGISKGNLGSGWISIYEYLQFNVTVTNPIPPAISIFQPVVLTFQVSGFPFVLQQSTSLAPTNWIAATNAIQIATVSTNQTVFMVPPSSQQMFFRLSAQ